MIRDQLAEALLDALRVQQVEPPEAIQLERPARREHGDWSSNVALATGKRAGRNPRELAQAIADHLNASPPPHVTAVEIAGAGLHQLPARRQLVARRVARGGRRRCRGLRPA